MENEQEQPAAAGPVDCRVRPLREGEVMAVYMDFDRHADKAWAPADYLLRFGAAVSEATAKANADEPLYTEQQIADACMAAEIPNSKCESLLIALAA
jgi:hypothetical protein